MSVVAIASNTSYMTTTNAISADGFDEKLNIPRSRDEMTTKYLEVSIYHQHILVAWMEGHETGGLCWE